jgi:methionine sulfoxide reductase heme-binding subunit
VKAGPSDAKVSRLLGATLALPAQFQLLNNRLRRRLLHHVLIGGGSVALTVIFIQLFPKRDPISRLSICTAYPALFLTAAALLLGPLNVLWRRPNPISFDLRRDLGIWAGICALVHTAAGLNVHLRGRMWLYFVDTRRHLRGDAFGFGNYTGAFAALIFALLLALSNDVSLRKLGLGRWKSLQRWAYAGIVLTAAHAIAYQEVEKRILPFEALLYITLGVVSIFQLTAIIKSRRMRAPP